MIFRQDAVHVGYVLAGDLLHYQSAIVRGEEETLALPLALQRGTAGQRSLRDHTHTNTHEYQFSSRKIDKKNSVWLREKNHFNKTIMLVYEISVPRCDQAMN